MVLEPNFMRVASSVRKNVGITQSIVELKLPTNEDVIDAVYSIGARSTIISSEPAGNEISFVGLVDFQAIYESQGVSAVDYTAEFKDKFTYQEELSGEIVLSSNVIDVTSSVVSSGIRVVAIIETTIDEIVSKNVNVLTGVAGDNVYLSKKEMTINSYIGKAVEKFDVSGEFEIKNVTKVLMVTPNVCVSNVEPKDNYMVVNGVVNIDVCYQSGDGVDSIRSMSDKIDFGWEVALDGVNTESCIQSAIDMLTNEIRVSTMLEDGNANININVPLMYAGYVFNQKNFEVVDDVYSQTNYLSVTSENFSTLKCVDNIHFRDAISGTAGIAETAPFIDEILGVCTNNIVLASSSVRDNKLCVEGVANVTVVYFTKETNGITSVQVEMPFMVEEKANGDKSSIVTLCLSDVNARSRRGKEIEVSAELHVFSDLYDTEELIAITEISVGEEKAIDDCSLYIYIVRGNETVWDIAKNMNVSPESILEQNPDIQMPLKVNDRLVIYKPHMCDF